MILVTQNGDEYEIRFPYDLEVISKVKEVPGRRWNPEEKFWSIPVARLGFLIAQFKGTPYESQVMIKSDEDINVNASIDEANVIPNIDILDVNMYVQEGGQLFNHQKDMLKFAKWRINNGLKSGFVLADEPGCISGAELVRIRQDHKKWTYETKLSNLYNLFQAGTFIEIKTMENGRFVYKPVANVLDKGMRPVLCIQTADHSIRCTPDHEIYTPKGWIPAEQLHVGDKVLMNGQITYKYNKAIFLDDEGNEVEQACPRCNSITDIVKEKGSKFLGYCRSCMYKLRSGKIYKDTDDTIHRKIDADGYVKLFGYCLRFHPVRLKYERGEGIYEHHYVWYEHTGHLIDTTVEEIHHKNKIKTDNRFENLELVSHSEHQQRHIDQAVSHLPQNHPGAESYYAHGKEIMLVPKEDTIVAIETVNELEHVYDVTIGDPIVHNFICNHFIVHNCGKTLEVTNWAMYLKDHFNAEHCLIIACVNSAKYNWREDIQKHTNGTEVPYILGSRLKRDGSINLSTGSKEKLEDLKTMKMYGKKDGEPLPYFIIINIEAIRMRTGKIYPIADRLIKLINDKHINIVALDEIHRNASMHSLQGRQILRIKKEVETQIQWIPMTGTPIVSKPTDVFLPLRLVDGHASSSYWSWCQKYCIYGGFGGHEIVGYKNIPQLKSILQPNMLRRLKKDILDLPPKIHYTEYIENSPYQEKLYQKILTDMISDRERIIKSLNPLAKFLHLRQVNGSPELVDNSISSDSKDYLSKNAKLSRLLELLDDILAEPSEKVVIFSNWVEPLRTLYKFVSKKYKVCCYTGTMSPDDRELHKKAFIEQPDRRIMIGTVGALGTSHTLTVARNVIFYDSPWNPADIEQTEDRCHRPGTTSSVFVYSLITKGTVDEKVHEILSRKEGTANYIVDNELDLRSHPELFDLLLRN